MVLRHDLDGVAEPHREDAVAVRVVDVDPVLEVELAFQRLFGDQCARAADRLAPRGVAVGQGDAVLVAADRIVMDVEEIAGHGGESKAFPRPPSLYQFGYPAMHLRLIARLSAYLEELRAS